MYRWLIIAALLATIGGGVFYYYTSTQNKIEQLTANNATLSANVQILVEANQQTLNAMDQLQEGYQEVQDNFTLLENEFQTIRAQNNLLGEKFDSNDIGRLAAARPGLIQGIINNASGNAGRCFELLTGSPLTQDERNAENANEFNSECPFLWTGDNSP
jgi:type II secretory pathway pseudopilin PulG